MRMQAKMILVGALLAQLGTATMGCRPGASPAAATTPVMDETATAASAPAATSPTSPTTAGAPDIASIGQVGQARVVVPVAGKITVVDFWAPWCEPCIGVAAGLAELAAISDIAVRKLEIADVDDPASVTYLNAKGFGLPHLKVYDAKGVLLGERSGGVSELLPWVTALIGPSAK